MWSLCVSKPDVTRACSFLMLASDEKLFRWWLWEPLLSPPRRRDTIRCFKQYNCGWEFWLYLGSHQLSWKKLCGATTWWELPLRLSLKRQQMVFLCHMRVSYTLNQLSERTELLLLLTLLWHQSCRFSWYMQGVYHGNRFLLHITLNRSDPWALGSFECLLCTL